MILALILVVNGVIPSEGDTRFDAVGRLNWYCSAVLVRPGVVLTARHCILEGQPHEVQFRNGEKSEVVGFYVPAVGDAALGYLDAPVAGIEPIKMSFGGASVGQDVDFAGTGVEGSVETCDSFVIYSDPTTIQMPGQEAYPPGCWLESGDSGGAVIVGGRALRVVGIGSSVSIYSSQATSLEQFASDPRFNLPELRRHR